MQDELKKLQNKKIALLGLGIENFSLANFLLDKKINCEITIRDARNKKELGDKYKELNKRSSKINWQLGKNYDKNLEKFDVLFRSPGWPLFKIKKTKKQKNKKISSSMQLFFEICPSKNIIGVTGTKGKGTTASLIYEILKVAGKKTWLGGNIGVAQFDFIDKIKKTDWVVLELSSFQLEDMTVSPRISVITNFYPEHLAPADPNNPNYHKSLKDYRDAKLNIVKWQSKKDWAILNYELRIRNYELNKLKSKICAFSAKNQNANCFWFDENKISCHDSSFIIHTSLLGYHNKENIAAAVEVAKIIGINKNVIAKAVKNFKGLPHRLELVKIINNVKYYDDSFATTPESTIIALKSFTQPIVILLGGADKGADFKQLAKEVKKQCKFVILLNGVATERIKKELINAGFHREKIKTFSNINQAVKNASKITVSGDIVLLSTACASFGMFKNYKERGDLFKQAVNKIKEK